VLANHRLQNALNVDLLFLDQLLLFRAFLTQVQLFFLAVRRDVGQMDRRRAGTALTFHARLSCSGRD
jgi:hypothetical protein